MEDRKYDLLIEENNINDNINLNEDIRSLINFLDYLKYIRNYSEKTIINYEIDMKQFINFLSFKGRNLDQVNKRFLRSYIANLKKEDLFNNKSIHRKISSLKSLFKYLTREKIVDINPALTLSFPKLEKKIPEVLTINEIESLLDSFIPETNKEIRDKAIIETFYSTGIRVSELTGIDISDIDMYSKSIKVLGKGRKERIVFLTKRCIKPLIEYTKIRSSFIPEGKRNNEVLFLNNKGDRINPSHIYKIVKNYSNKISSGKKVSPHTFRHSFATHLMNNGADIRLVQELLGHKSITSTQIYTHVSKNRLRDIYRKFHPHAKQ